MSRVVWIDKSNVGARTERLRLAHIKARQKRIEAAYRGYRREDKLRGYPVYEVGRKYRNGPQRRSPVDSLMLIGALASIYIILSLIDK